MKARVKNTGEIIDVIPYNRDGFAYIQDDGETVYEFHELEILDDPDYWIRLEHQAAIAAMQGALANNDLLMQLLKRAKSGSRITHVAVKFANACAHALVEKLKESK